MSVTMIKQRYRIIVIAKRTIIVCNEAQINDWKHMCIFLQIVTIMFLLLSFRIFKQQSPWENKNKEQNFLSTKQQSLPTKFFFLHALDKIHSCRYYCVTMNIIGICSFLDLFFAYFRGWKNNISWILQTFGKLARGKRHIGKSHRCFQGI